MAQTALLVPPRTGNTPARWVTFHNFMIAICIAILCTRIYKIVLGGGWEDRGQFFGEGELRPNLVDFIYNEVLISYLIIRVISFRFNILVVLIIALSSLAYFTRLPLILLVFSVLFSAGITKKMKIVIGGLAFALSAMLLYVRFGEDIIYSENSSVFFLTYPLIGLARLQETTQEFSVYPLQYIALFFKPLDSILFVIDYAGNYAGELSVGRHVGLELSRFVYIQSLQSAYNAFGTVLYPFVLIAGWYIGPILFLLFILFQYLQYKVATQSDIISRRYIYLLLTTGILFSWTSPFVWMAPFLFTKFRQRSRA